MHHRSQRGNLPGREGLGGRHIGDSHRGLPVWGGFTRRRCGDELCFHIEPPTSIGRRSCVQTFPGPKVIRGGPILYGVVRASAGFPIQSGPPRFAPYPGCKGTWPFCLRFRVNWLIRPAPHPRPPCSPTPPPPGPARVPCQLASPPRHQWGKGSAPYGCCRADSLAGPWSGRIATPSAVDAG